MAFLPRQHFKVFPKTTGKITHDKATGFEEVEQIAGGAVGGGPPQA